MDVSQRGLSAILATGAAALLLAACGGGSSGGSATSAPTTGAGADTAASPSTPVTATETEYAITLSTPTLTAGVYTFAIRDQGKFSHNLAIKGPGVDSQTSPTLQSGATGQLTVRLQKGSYELWCAVDSHKDRGMDLTVNVG